MSDEQTPQPSQPSQPSQQDSQLRAQVLLSNKKSQGIAFLLTLLFGPLGMIYATVVGAIVMFIVNVAVVILTFGLGFLLTWPIMLAWTYFAIRGKNEAIDQQVLSS
ncbi:hypothetical protein [Ferruginivarius sediminum]|uniref:hypothetical protein n=1 Tax=Ferruginivarius sediminum TaxID=2661937 RepID=UPI001F4E2779|nr:hypothetical protein [Ferruginivarius sediminum]